MTVAWVFPGQGSQKIGMAKQIENLPNTKERFSYASEIFERNLFEICELNTEPTNPLIDLNNTRNTQICLFLVESILLDALKENGFKPTYVAGHSLGEITALYSADVFSFEDCVSLIKERSQLMVNAGKGSMAAVIGFDMRTDGERGSFLNLSSKNNKDTIIDNIDFLSGAFSPIQMNGQEVYKFAVREVPIILEKLFKKINYTSDEVDWLVLHQANQRILDSVGDRLKIPREKILSNLEKYGNTSAATIPLVLDEAIKNNRVKQNDIIATSGFGAGLSWGAALIKWG